MRILNPREPLSSGGRYDVRCRSVGARPHPKVTWWIGGNEIRDGIGYKVRPTPRVTRASLTRPRTDPDFSFTVLPRRQRDGQHALLRPLGAGRLRDARLQVRRHGAARLDARGHLEARSAL